MGAASRPWRGGVVQRVRVNHRGAQHGPTWRAVPDHVREAPGTDFAGPALGQMGGVVRYWSGDGLVRETGTVAGGDLAWSRQQEAGRSDHQWRGGGRRWCGGGAWTEVA